MCNAFFILKVWLKMHVRSDKSGGDKQTYWACIKLLVLTAVPQANSPVMVIISYSFEYQQSHLFSSEAWHVTLYSLRNHTPNTAQHKNKEELWMYPCFDYTWRVLLAWESLIWIRTFTNTALASNDMACQHQDRHRWCCFPC